MIHDHPNFPSAHLPSTRTISVYLPHEYDQDPTRRFPVLYMQDGQNLFDPAKAFAGNPWHCDATVEQVTQLGLAEPILIVGVANTPKRIQEYGYYEVAETVPPSLAREYGRFLVEEVKPFIDATYRTRSHSVDTGIGGSSMGGLIALQLAKWYPDVFGKCAAMSPSLWWDGESFLRHLSSESDWLRTVRLWLDMGGREGWTKPDQLANLQRCRRATTIFKAHRASYQYLEATHAEHNEAAWGERFAEVLAYLYPASTEFGDP